MLFSDCCYAGAWNDVINEEKIHGESKHVGVCLECKEHCKFITQEEYDEELSELYQKDMKEMQGVANNIISKEEWKDFQKLKDGDVSDIVMKEMGDFLKTKNNKWGEYDGREVAFGMLHSIFMVLFDMTNSKSAMSLITMCLFAYISCDEMAEIVSETVENKVKN